MEKSSVVEIGKQCLRDEAEAILAMLDHVDEHFEKAVDLICNCKGKVIVTGVGKSGHIGSKIAATLASTGTPAFFLNPLDAYHGDLGMLSEDDIVLAISYSGATEELLRFLPLIQAKKIRIIGISGNDESLLARCSDIHLNVAVEHEADPLNLIPTASTAATLALGDALACALMEAKHFQPTDFAKLHPGGDLGRKLLAKVEDVMFTENLPFLTPETTLREAIEIVTNGKLGVGIVVETITNHQSPITNLVGIITDGDIRRAMQRLGQDFFATPVSAIMSKNPKTIFRSARIVEAGEKMNHHSIHTLIVLDDSSHVCGIIDSFSCLPGTRFYH